MTCTSLIPQQYNSFYLKPIKESDVFRYLQQLNPAKCVESESYPDILKIAQVVPIHKNGSKDQG